MTIRPDSISVTCPVSMGLRLLESGGQPEIFCEKCNGWVVWDLSKGKEECPGCWTFNKEAAALIRGIQSARTIIAFGGVKDGKQLATAGDRYNGPEGERKGPPLESDDKGMANQNRPTVSDA